MRILFLGVCIPYPLDAGGKIRTYHLVRGLARRHEVFFFGIRSAQPEEEVGIEKLKGFCAGVEAYWPAAERGWSAVVKPALVRCFHSASLKERLREVLDSSGRFDAIHVDELCLAPYVLRSRAFPKVLHRQKIDYVFYRALRQRDPSIAPFGPFELWKLLRYERWASRRFDHGVVPSPHDGTRWREIGVRLPWTVVPNGVDLDTYRPGAVASVSNAHPPTLVFVGSMDYPPNVEAMRFYFDEVHPRVFAEVPSVRVVVVGREPVAEVRAHASRPNVLVTGRVPDVRPYLASATAVICPVRIGEGTRLKILEALAMGKAVISTTVGCEGLELIPEREILVADAPTDFARATVRAVRDGELRRRLGEAGRTAVTARYGWDAIVEGLERAYGEAVSAWHVRNSRGIGRGGSRREPS